MLHEIEQEGAYLRSPYPVKRFALTATATAMHPLRSGRNHLRLLRGKPESCSQDTGSGLQLCSAETDQYFLRRKPGQSEIFQIASGLRIIRAIKNPGQTQQ